MGGISLNNKKLINMVRKLTLGSGEVAIFWLGQNSFIIKTPKGTTFAIDPYLSREKVFKYVYPRPPVEPEDFKVDYIFCTHDHLDHTDPKALPIIAKHHKETIFFGPEESCKHLLRLGVEEKRVNILRAGNSYKICDIKVTAYYSIQPGEKYIWANTTHLGYIFEVEGIKLYNMGDASLPEETKKILDPVAKESVDIAMLPIIGDIPERKPEDAFIFAKIIKPKVVIPAHYDCFRDRTIDPKVFAQLFEHEPGIEPIIIPYKGFYIYKKALTH
jgi:L-ascorbate 6-phosphate lactonase